MVKKNRIRNKLPGFLLLIVITSLACNVLTPGNSSSNSSEPVLKVDPPANKAESLPPSRSLDGWVTFTNQDNLYSLDIPNNWLTGHWFQDDLPYFVENFQSSDKKSYMEVFVSDDGRPFPDVDEKYIYALSVLDRLYASGIKEEKRTVENDGAREILIWRSQNSRFISVYEVTGKTTFIMLTLFGYTPEKETSTEFREIIKNFKVQQSPARENPTQEPSSEIEYKTVAEALAELRQKEGVKVSVSQGWTIITDDQASIMTMWSFAPKDHPAYPAVAKRVFYEEQDSWYVEMSILCEANQEACDAFDQDFVKLNEEMSKYILKDQLRQYLEQMQGK
jgi:hypothetical protein